MMGLTKVLGTHLGRFSLTNSLEFRFGAQGYGLRLRFRVQGARPFKCEVFLFADLASYAPHLRTQTSRIEWLLPRPRNSFVDVLIYKGWFYWKHRLPGRSSILSPKDSEQRAFPHYPLGPDKTRLRRGLEFRVYCRFFGAGLRKYPGLITSSITVLVGQKCLQYPKCDAHWSHMGNWVGAKPAVGKVRILLMEATLRP